MTAHVLPRFFSAVQKHLFFNFSAPGLRSPLLAIVGPSGEGKTFQLEESLRQCHTTPYWIAAGDMESEFASRPTSLLIDTIRTAAEGVAKGHPSAVIVHDIDTTLGEWKDNTGTVNHQQLIGELMNFADRPADTRYGSRAVPIFVTGNDLTKLYGPLTRSRRMTLFEWRPSAEEKIEVVTQLLGPVTSGDVAGVARDLVAVAPAEPLAFFGDLIGQCVEDLVLSTDLLGGVTDMRAVLKRRTVAALPVGVTREHLTTKVHELQAARAGARINYLEETGS